MANDMKSGIGFVIPAAGVVGFFTSLLMGEFLVSIIITVSGILVWFLYMLVMESHMPQQMGNMIILFGVMLSLGIFFGFGITQNMWGGFEFQPEGSILSLVILFFAVLTGLNFRNQQSSFLASAGDSGGLSDEDRDLVMNAINQTQASKATPEPEAPKVIVVKQEAAPVEEKAEEKKEEPLPPNPHDHYGMANNPYFSYPPDYYYDEDEDDWDDEDEDDWDDEDEDENE